MKCIFDLSLQKPAVDINKQIEKKFRAAWLSFRYVRDANKLHNIILAYKLLISYV